MTDGSLLRIQPRGCGVYTSPLEAVDARVRDDEISLPVGAGEQQKTCVSRQLQEAARVLEFRFSTRSPREHERWGERRFKDWRKAQHTNGNPPVLAEVPLPASYSHETTLGSFQRIIGLDFEFVHQAGEPPRPVCCVAREFLSGREWRHWVDPLNSLAPPFPTDGSTLIVGFAVEAELLCFDALGWRYPELLLDLRAEAMTEMRDESPRNFSLLDCLKWFGIPTPTATEEKAALRGVIMQGGPFDAQQREEILNYCANDVSALEPLLERIVDRSEDIRQRLFRGEFMKANSSVAAHGPMFEMELFQRLRAHHLRIRHGVATRTNERLGFPVLKTTTIQQVGFREFLAARGLLESWTKTDTGKLATSRKVFSMYESDPDLAFLFNAKEHLLRLGTLSFPVGCDGRNRCHQAPFHTTTGRSCPSNAESVFGAAKALRSLIQPAPGRAVVRADWKAQEGIIAAVLSGDKNMLKVYRAEDPYMQAAILAGAAPVGATKATHPEVRARFKVALLGGQYGMGVASLATKTKLSLEEAKKLHAQMHRTFASYWQWRERIYTLAQLTRHQRSLLGWTMHWRGKLHALSAQNWPVQSLGSEMMRVAAINLYREGFLLIGLVHDAVLVECNAEEAELVAHRIREVMRLASAVLLAGEAIAVDVAVVRHPDRYRDEGGAEMWQWLMEELETAENTNEPD